MLSQADFLIQMSEETRSRRAWQNSQVMPLDIYSDARWAYLVRARYIWDPNLCRARKPFPEGDDDFLVVAIPEIGDPAYLVDQDKWGDKGIRPPY